MPITVKEMRSGAAPRQRNIASLVGGYVIAVGCFALFMLCMAQLAGRLPDWPVIAIGVLFAGVIGVWIRLADL